MKRKIKTYITAAGLIFSLGLAGCAGTEESTAASVTQEAAAETAATETLDGSAYGADTDSAAADDDKAADSTGAAAIDFSSGVSDDDVKGAVYTDGMTDFTVTAHNIEEGSDKGDQYIARDTVSISYTTVDSSGLFPQTVTKDLCFYMNNAGTWEMLDDVTTSCNVDSSAIAGSSWQSADGSCYFRFNKKAGLFAFNMKNEKNTSTERFYTTSGIGGKLTKPGEEENEEVSFKLTEGSVKDSGELIMIINTDTETFTLNVGTDILPITEQEYDVALGAEVEEGKVYLENLSTFEVTTSSIVDNEWKQECGGSKGNLSPELTWEAVDGASQYAVIMLDKIAHNWLHWFALTDATHLDEGQFADRESGYYGPYPPETHEYTIYVVALADAPEKDHFLIDTTGGDIDSILTKLNTASDGSTGNVISYGMIAADYTPSERTYR